MAPKTKTRARILKMLQETPRPTVLQMAHRLKLSPQAVYEQLGRIERDRQTERAS